MRYTVLILLFFSVLGTAPALCLEKPSGETLAAPAKVSDQALGTMIEYGRELSLRRQFDQAAKVYMRVLSMDPCKKEAREELAGIAERAADKKNILDLLNGLKCETPQPLVPETTIVSAPAPSKDAPLASQPAPTINPMPVATQTAPLEGNSLPEKTADLQRKLQRAIEAAQSQNARLNKLNSEQPVTQN